MRYLLFLCLLTLCGCVHQTAAPKPVHHVVLVWVKPALGDAYVESLKQASLGLGLIPGVQSVHVGQPLQATRPMVDDSYSIAVYFEFDTTRAMEAYIAHPDHQAFIRQFIRGKVDKIVIYDFQ